MEESRRGYYRGIVLETLRARHWRLVSDLDDFVDRVCTRLSLKESPVELQKGEAVELATAREYSVVLYEAWAGSDLERQKQAAEETHTRYYGIALAKLRDQELARGPTQEALRKTVASLVKVRDHTNFLSFTRQIILNTIRDHIRRLQTEAKRLVPLEERTSPPDSEFPDPGDDEPASRDPAAWTVGDTGEIVMLDKEYRQEIVEIIRQCVRSPRQQAVLIAQFIENDSYDEIAHDMQIKANNARQLGHAGLKNLKKCAKFLAFVKDRWPWGGANA